MNYEQKKSVFTLSVEEFYSEKQDRRSTDDAHVIGAGQYTAPGCSRFPGTPLP